MPDTGWPEDFEHVHRDAVRTLDLDITKLAADHQAVLASLDQELVSTVQELLLKLSPDAVPRPDQVFRHALEGLDRIEAQRFLVENLLESVKRGESISKVLSRYKNLGLLKATAVPEGKAGTADAQEDGTAIGPALMRRKKGIRRIVTDVIHIAINALKSVPDWVEIKPHIHLLPVPSLSFSIEGKGKTVQEIFEILRGSTSDA